MKYFTLGDLLKNVDGRKNYIDPINGTFWRGSDLKSDSKNWYWGDEGEGFVGNEIEECGSRKNLKKMGFTL